MEKKKRLTSMVFLTGLLALSVVIHAGSLEPSAPPGPTMKTLNEVEPRVPIHASDLPLTISEPNSYYLVEDVNFTDDVDAITIECNDVTIDLMGYTLKGPDSDTVYGIYMNSRSNVEVRNGTVRDFYNGIYEAGSSGQNHHVIDVRLVSNSVSGIILEGSGHLVKNCAISENGALAAPVVYGIYVGNGNTVTGNTVYSNGYSAGSFPVSVYGIYAKEGGTMTGNTVYYNGTSADSQVYGIWLDGYNLVDQNTAYKNGFGADSATNITLGVTGCVYGNNVAP